MYDERRNSVNWKDLIIKIILVVLFIFLLFWIIPRPNLNPFYDRIFNANIQTMQLTARNHYTVDRLPNNIGDSKSMTLQEMLNNKMILPFVDRDGNTCNTQESFIKVTKTGEQEFSLRIQLSCGNHTDYILDTIGCYNVCVGNDCRETCSVTDCDTTEYRHKRKVTRDVTNYTCPKGYTRVGNRCYTSVTSKKPAIPVRGPDTVKITEPNRGAGESHRVYTDPIEHTGTGHWTCPEGYTLSGSTCTRVTTSSIPATWVAGGTTLTCPAGWTREGNNCFRAATWVAGATTLSCPAGWTREGNNCFRASTFGPWFVVSRPRSTTPLSTYTTETERLTFTGTTREFTCANPAQCPVMQTFFNYVLERRNRVCSVGTLSGTRCVIAATSTTGPGHWNCTTGNVNGNRCQISATSTPGTGHWSCTTGTLSGQRCQIPATSTPSNGHWSCPNGYTLDGQTCTRTVTSTINATWVYGVTTYSCPSGYTSSGTGSNLVCYRIVTTEGELYCPDSRAELIDGKCHRKVPGPIIRYKCPEGKKLKGKKCYWTARGKSIPATPRTTTKSSWEFKWSTEQRIDGWEPTGETRIKDRQCPECPECPKCPENGFKK